MRQELAERLHDGPIQELIGARMRLIALMESSELNRAELAPLAESIEAAIEELRRIVQSGPEERGHDPGGSRPDLYARLGELCTEFRAETGISCTFEILPEHTRFGYHLSDVLHRSVKELLTNVRKHAEAARVRLVSGRSSDGAVYIGVEDDGVGFGSIRPLRSSAGRQGFGLWSIEHRLRHFDGYTEIESIDGVRVRIVLPARLLEA